MRGFLLVLVLSSMVNQYSTVISARAWSMDTPGFKRPIRPRLVAAEGTSGNQMSVLDPICNPKNADGAMPMTVTGTSCTIIDLPRTAGSRLNLLFQ